MSSQTRIAASHSRRAAPATSTLAVAIGQALHTPRNKRRASAALALAALALAAPVAQAQSTDWTGAPGVSLVWENNSNWSNNAPTGNSANITNGGDARITSIGQTDELTVNGGSLVWVSTPTAELRSNRAFVDGGGAVDVLGTWNAGELNVGIDGAGRVGLTNGAALNSVNGIFGVNAGGIGRISVATGSIWNLSDILTIGQVGEGHLVVASGGKVTADSATTIGDFAGSEGYVAVDGAGSSLVAGSQLVPANELIIGHFGAGTLAISNGATVLGHTVPQPDLDNVIGAVRIADEAGSTGRVTVDGAGSSFTSTGNLFIGRLGNGSLEITNGGDAYAVQGVVGYRSGGVGSVVVDGAGSSFNIEEGLLLASDENTTGSMTIRNGGTVNTGFANLAFDPTTTATVLVDGAGSIWNSAGGIGLGINGSASLNIRNGGAVSSGFGAIGAGEGSTGDVVVENAGSRWDNDGLIVGDAGVGSLTIRDGGVVNSGTGSVGRAGSSSGVQTLGDGTVVVQGTGSSWAITGALDVGAARGTVTVRDGAALSSGDAVVGNFYSDRYGNISGDDASVLIDGAGSSWTSTGTIAAGLDGNGLIVVQNGGTITSDGGAIGLNARSREASIVVDGAGSSWTNANDLTVGVAGAGTLLVQNGGALANTFATIGREAGSGGLVRIDGSGSTWTNSAGLNIGGHGDGIVEITDGGWMSSGDTALGAQPDGRGALRVSGAGSHWENISAALVGWAGIGELIVENGGTVSSNEGYMGEFAGSNGLASVIGAGSQWDVQSGSLDIGDHGSATLTVADGGKVVAPDMLLARSAGSTGTLNIGEGGLSGTVETASITGGAGKASVAFNHSDDIAFGTLMTGSLAVDKIGSGKTTLTADNDYTGLTAIGAGILQLGDGGNTGGVTGDIDNDATLVIDRANTYAYAGTIGGSGVVHQAGTGTTVFTGDNTYTGGTFIDAGTLQLGDGGNTGSVTSNIVNNATLVIDRGNAFDYAATIVGSGALHQAGTGATTFTGDQAYTGGTFVDAGTLRIGNGGTTGSLVGNVAIASDGTFAFDRSDSFGFDGALSGNGAFDKLGAGTLTLTGNSGAFVGNGTLHSGGLRMMGTIGGDMDVLFGAMLSGNGTLGSVDNAGTISPGSSIGTLHLTGDYLHRDGATYLVDIEPHRTSDLIDVAGTATIEGGDVSVDRVPGQYRGGTRYTIVDADGGVSGTFDVLNQIRRPFLDLALAYDANHVYLDVLRSNVDFGDLCPNATFNQCQVAGAVDKIATGGPLQPDLQTAIDELTTLQTDEALTAFDRMSGEAHASLAGILLEGHALFGQTVTRRLADRREAVGATRLEGGTWARAYGASAELDGDGNAYGADYNLHGLAVGFDAWGTEEWLIGASANLMRADADFRPGDNAEVDAKNLSIYTSYHGKHAYLDGVVSFAWWDNDVTRSVDIGTIHRTAKSDYGSNRLALYLESGWKFDIAKNQTLQPLVSFQRDKFDTQAFREHGAGDLDLISHSQGGDRITTGVGLLWSGAFKRGDWTIEPTAQARWLHSIGDQTMQFGMAFAGAPDIGFQVRGATLPEDRGVIGLGLAARKGNTDLFVDYDYQQGDGFKAHNLSAGLRYRW